MTPSTTRTSTRDYKSGERDAEGGFYDKWFRYNRIDEGAAYDAGFQFATKHPNGCQIIECTA